MGPTSASAFLLPTAATAPAATLVLSQAQPPLTKDQKRHLADQASTLWLVLAGIAAATIIALALIVTLRWVRRTRRLFASQRKPLEFRDAWAEAGKRVSPEPQRAEDDDADDDEPDPDSEPRRRSP